MLFIIFPQKLIASSRLWIIGFINNLFFSQQMDNSSNEYAFYGKFKLETKNFPYLILNFSSWCIHCQKKTHLPYANIIFQMSSPIRIICKENKIYE